MDRRILSRAPPLHECDIGIVHVVEVPLYIGACCIYCSALDLNFPHQLRACAMACL